MTKHWLIAVCSAAIIICLFEDVQANQCSAGCYLRCKTTQKTQKGRSRHRSAALGCKQRCDILAQHCISCSGNKCLQCASGYKKLPKFGCQAVSCSINNGGCSPHATCTQDSAGTISCACKPGFAGDGYKCTDIDECVFGNYGGCSTEAICTNTIGSVTCTCKTGYTAAGTACVGWTLQSKSGKNLYVYSDEEELYAGGGLGPQNSFLILPCLAPNVLKAESSARCVTFQPEFYPGNYLRHYTVGSFTLLKYMPMPATGDDTYKADASFIMLTDLWMPGYAAFQSVNNPELFIHIPSSVSAVEVRLERYDGTDTFRQYASFQLGARPNPVVAVAV